MDLSKYQNVYVLNHPLLKHKITMLRDVNTPTNEFRRIVKEIAIMEGYEALKHIPTHNVDVQTPIELTSQPVVDSKKLCFVPILRAGLGMVDGIRSMIPTAKIGFIGMYRDEETLKPHAYFSKLPPNIQDAIVMLVDPMLATGGSAAEALTLLKNKGCKDIRFVGLVAAPEGIAHLQKEHPDVDLYFAALDEKLNENGYIVPGLGDCGDRLFGTK